jgi:hypothetical protein
VSSETRAGTSKPSSRQHDEEPSRTQFKPRPRARPPRRRRWLPGRRAGAGTAGCRRRRRRSSSALARRLSTPGLFALGRPFVAAADACVVDAGGVVGRHAGDGASPPCFCLRPPARIRRRARACIASARALRVAAAGVAERCNLDARDVVLRFGLHWGATVYVGQLLTRGRAEVVALGEEVNGRPVSRRARRPVERWRPRPSSSAWTRPTQRQLMSTLTA